MALGYGHPIIQVDPRDEKPAFKEIKKHLETVRLVQKIRNEYVQASYRTACMEGQSHPMEIEQHEYMLLVVRTQDIDQAFEAEKSRYGPHYYNQAETEFIKNMMRAPEVEWAVDNSFDGIYILREHDHASFRTIYKFAVYLKKEQVTFWKLKFSGQ